MMAPVGAQLIFKPGVTIVLTVPKREDYTDKLSTGHTAGGTP